MRTVDDQTLRELLGGMESRLNSRLDAIEAGLKTYVDERIGEMETRLKAYVDEQLHELETKLLSAFFSYQERADVRFRKMEADISNINASSKLLLDNLEKRVLELEKRVWMGGTPPQAPPPAA